MKKFYLFPLALFLFIVTFTIPARASVYKSTVSDEKLTFSRSDFAVAVADIKDLDGLIICETPDPCTGVLKFGTRDILVGEAISESSIRHLKFIPTINSGNSLFTCIPVYKSGKIGKAINVSVNILKEENVSPSAEPINIKTAKNMAIYGRFSGSDPEREELKYTVISSPEHGQVELCPDEPGKFLYTPYKNKTGIDTFKYTVTDAHGNVSLPATVTVEILRSRLKLTYSDMEENGYHYQAITLANKNILKGEIIGDKAFLRPTRVVSGDEFISMVSAMISRSRKLSKSDFANSKYAEETVSAISGNQADEKSAWMSEPIFYSDAVEILSQVITSSKNGNPDIILNSALSFPDKKVTRQDAVELLYNTLYSVES